MENGRYGRYGYDWPLALPLAACLSAAPMLALAHAFQAPVATADTTAWSLLPPMALGMAAYAACLAAAILALAPLARRTGLFLSRTETSDRPMPGGLFLRAHVSYDTRERETGRWEEVVG